MAKSALAPHLLGRGEYLGDQPLEVPPVPNRPRTQSLDRCAWQRQAKRNEGLVRTAEDALTVLRQASQPLGPMGAEWLKRQELSYRKF